MSPELRMEFNELARELIHRAEIVHCSFEDFRVGLKIVRDAVNSRLESADTEGELFGKLGEQIDGGLPPT